MHNPQATTFFKKLSRPLPPFLFCGLWFCFVVWEAKNYQTRLILVLSTYSSQVESYLGSGMTLLHQWEENSRNYIASFIDKYGPNPWGLSSTIASKVCAFLKYSCRNLTAVTQICLSVLKCFKNKCKQNSDMVPLILAATLTPCHYNHIWLFIIVIDLSMLSIV